jgi:hypothetical protein
VHLINWKYAEKASVLLTATHPERIAKKQEDEAGKCPQISVICRVALRSAFSSRRESEKH